jgi:MFS transporter, DHA1 family, inner membrane transport protein
MTEDKSATFNPDAPISIISYVLTAAVASLMIALGPIIIGAYIDVLGLTEKQAVQIFSTEMAGFSFGGVIVFLLLSRVNWRHIVLGAFTFLILGNFLTLSVDTLQPLLIVRFLSGIGGGTLMSMTVVSIGMTKSPERIYGLWLASQYISSAIAVAIVARLIPEHGLAAPSIIFAILGLSIIWVFLHFPERSEVKSGGSSIAGTRKALILGVLGLLGIFVFYGGQAAVWAYVERIGIAAEFTSNHVANAISIALLAGIGGALLATALGNKFGRRMPMIVTIIFSTITVYFLLDTTVFISYIIALCLFNVAWQYSTPYLQSTIANIDASGRLLSLVAIVIPASISAGPAVVSLLLVEGGAYTAILWVLIVSLPLGFLLLNPAARIEN